MRTEEERHPQGGAKSVIHSLASNRSRFKRIALLTDPFHILPAEILSALRHFLTCFSLWIPRQQQVKNNQLLQLSD